MTTTTESTSHIPKRRKPLPGHRSFGYYKPAGRRPTEYEDLTCDQQSDPSHFAFQGWPIRFDDGRDPITTDSTVLRSTDWFAFRDPNKTMNRGYVASTNEVEKGLSHSIDGAIKAGHFEFANPEWIEGCLAKHFMTYPHVNYGLFLALCYAEREALSDTVTLPIVFEATDKLRHLQDAVHYSFGLAEEFPNFSDADAADTWKRNPIWQGARKAVEHLIACNDWMETVVAANLCIDRLFGEFAKKQYFGRFAAANGDLVTPLLIASAEGDDTRTMVWTRALMEHLVGDPEHGERNRKIINDWIEKWDDFALDAAEAFAPAFDQAPARPQSFREALARATKERNEILNELGLTPSQRSLKGANNA